MIIQNYTFKGIPLHSALRVTSTTKTNNIDWTFNLNIIINRYTDEGCEYDIEQFSHSFNNLTQDDVTTDISALDNWIEDLLLTLPEFEWARKI